HLAGSGRADQYHALWNPAAEFLKFFRIPQKFDELLNFILRFLDPGNIAECDLVFVAGEHARLRLAEIKRTFASHADLLAKQEIKHEQEQSDRQKPNHS